jgi:hypothetical protein
MLALALFTLAAAAQTDPLSSYFLGKEVLVKIDMPGSQQGIDLKFNQDNPMNWKEYSGRLKKYGVAIPKGTTSRITGFVVKNDRIEFQLDGGGFGTFFDDSDTTVAAKTVDKSDYEKQLERDIANATDPDQKRQLQRDLDRERARRQRENDSNAARAQVASQVKAQQVADNRLRGGSRFNLRWSGSIPADQKTPEAIMKLLSEYVSFPGAAAPPAQAVAAAPAPALSGAAVPATAHLQRGMKMSDVDALFGPGKQMSESVSTDGLKTQVYVYTTGDRKVDVTYVEGLVVRYSITSN